MIAIGPVADGLDLLVLWTAGDALVNSLLDCIEAENVEHAVVIGGTASVPQDDKNTP